MSPAVIDGYVGSLHLSEAIIDAALIILTACWTWLAVWTGVQNWREWGWPWVALRGRFDDDRDLYFLTSLAYLSVGALNGYRIWYRLEYHLPEPLELVALYLVQVCVIPPMAWLAWRKARRRRDRRP